MSTTTPQGRDWLAGKVVVVTGAGSGIGRAVSVLAARHGARLAISDVDATGLAETAATIKQVSGLEAHTDKLDVRDRDGVKAYAAAVAADLGGVDAVVNNAGVALNGDFADLDYESLEWIMDIDFWGVVHGSKEFLPYLVASGDGRLVNISSLFGLMAVPGQSAYNAAKFAVRGLTEALRQEMVASGTPVKVTCVHPGGIKTAIARNARAVGQDQAKAAELFDKKLARMSPERAAEIIVDGMVAGRARVIVGVDAKALDLMVRILGSGYQRLVTASARRATRGLR
ncbi:SDR family NAD(P)-dependent oxidoreductase [Nocardioides marmoribigeumensis]|jgi:short-subunit dehydrogenase|uniref:Short-subunit dehydrogenase n=1 Tax=Nocardioides marmoribigeumensis TaxID=433649 RepID=A0ABU2C1Y4_9ACTN|nr:SDR family NAD(P)-dependent oxidoreductase [Nocardioides marmoribigeumensis]MDR7364651.1 short-subunit dehydrogenase [Nocardioides marmoribigeumensis]